MEKEKRGKASRACRCRFDDFTPSKREWCQEIALKAVCVSAVVSPPVSPFLSDDYRRLPPRWFGNFLESLRCVQVQRYAPSKGDSRLLLQPALKKVGERSEEMMLSHYFTYLILYY